MYSLVRDVDNGGGCAWERGVGAVWELPVPSSQFPYEPKTALKNEVYLKNSRQYRRRCQRQEISTLAV